ncbi:hypothetical protein CN918_29120 [Priestia megaterium]|nr:hypothetical protein CN918_29120 [Priestia megaterium]
MNQTKTYFNEEDITQFRKWMADGKVYDVYTSIAAGLGLKGLVMQFDCIQRLNAHNGSLEPGLLEVRNRRVQQLKKALIDRLNEAEFRRMSEFV